MTPLRILFITTGLATGGAEMALLRLIRHLPADMSPHVVSLTDSGTVGARLSALGVSVETLGMRPGRPSLAAFLRLVRLIRERNPDIVQTWMYHADLMGGLAARLAGAGKVVWGIRHSNLDADKNKWRTRMVVRVCAMLSRRLPVAILSCSETARRVHEGVGYHARKFVVLPNGVELDSFKPDGAARVAVRTLLGVPANAPLVGLIARFDPQKNHQGFFEAAKQLRGQRPDVHFLLVGRGVDAANTALCVWRDTAGVGSVAHLCGERGDVQMLMAALDVLVSTSWGEAFPNVLAEAMACGVPCVATDVGDSAQIVGDTGHVVSVGDMLSLARAVEELLSEDESSRVTRADRARARITERYEIAAVAGRYAAFYRSLV